MKTQRSALKNTVRRLKEAGLETPVLDGRLLVEFALGVGWAELFTGADRDLAEAEADKVEAVVRRRLAREPVSRIVGRRAFWKQDLALSPATLDPRPDTETLVMAVVKTMPDIHAPLTILDLGTGSGAILLALLGEFPNATGLGIDISGEAAATAAANALQLGLHRRAEFAARDWNDGLDGRYDIVVSNPPYIPSADILGLDPEVKDFDPLAALDGGADGLDAYRVLAKLVPAVLEPDGLLALEAGIGQADEIEALFAGSGLGQFRRWKDLGGIDRVLTNTAREKVFT